MGSRRRPAIGMLAFVALALMLGGYFTFAAVQGDHGLFRRAENGEADTLRAERDRWRPRCA